MVTKFFGVSCSSVLFFSSSAFFGYYLIRNMIGSAVFSRFVVNEAAMSTDDTTLKTVQAFLGAMGARNLDAIVALFAEQVDWYIPGDEKLAPWLGKRTGKKAVRDFFALLAMTANARANAEVKYLFW